MLCERYKNEIDKLLSTGFAEKINEVSVPAQGKSWYIPHHAVLNQNKPDKLRVVNDRRQKKYAVMSDVEAMYHQVIVPEEQRDALRFLWWADGVY